MLVKVGLAKLNPMHCLYKVGMFERVFSAVCQGPINVEIIKSIGFVNMNNQIRRK
jgi:hypothetical protein